MTGTEGTGATAREMTRKLREHFGFRRFRPGQERVVRAAMDGRDTIVIMPPLIIRESEMAYLLKVVKEAIDEVTFSPYTPMDASTVQKLSV